MISEAVKKYPDFVAVALDNGLTYTDAMAEAIADSPATIDLAYHLGKHPEEVERIAGLPTANAQRRAIYEIETGLNGNTPDNSQKSITKKRAPSATEPIPPLPTGSSAGAYDPETADPDTYFRVENQREIERRQRGR